MSARANPDLLIEIFTDSQRPVTVVQESVLLPHIYYEVDKADRLLEKLNQAIAGLEEAVAEQVASDFGHHYKEQIRLANQGKQKAYDYGLTHLPAIVFNHGEAVVYGQTHLFKATLDYQQWKDKQRNG